MTRPRTPEHFPRMKVRGGRRRHHERSTQRKALVAHYVSLGSGGSYDLGDLFTRAVDRFVSGMTAFANAIAGHPAADDHALAGPR